MIRVCRSGSVEPTARSQVVKYRVTRAPVAVSWIGIAFASDGVLRGSVSTVNVFTLPDAAPEANVTVPLVSV